MPEASEQTDQQSGRGDGDDGDDPSSAQTFRAVFSQVGELRDYAVQYLVGQVDALIASCRRRAAWTMLAMVALLVAISAVITGVVLLICGLAQAVAALCGGNAWAGNLIVGALLLTIVIGGGWIGISRWFDSMRRSTVARYEQRLQQQRARHGYDARQRSAEFNADQSNQGASHDRS
jgi:hypothetical protein